MTENRINSSEVDEDWWTFSRLILMHQFVFPKLMELGYEYKVEILESHQANGAEVRITGNIPLLFQTLEEEIGPMCTFQKTRKQYEEWIFKHNSSSNS